VRRLAYAPVEGVLALLRSAGKIEVLDARTFASVAKFPTGPNSRNVLSARVQLGWSFDGRLLTALDEQGQVRVWETAAGWHQVAAFVP
jgi:hypothetical protein